MIAQNAHLYVKYRYPVVCSVGSWARDYAWTSGVCCRDLIPSL